MKLSYSCLLFFEISFLLSLNQITTGSAQNPVKNATETNSESLFQGDILGRGGRKVGLRLLANGMYYSKLWPNGIVPYFINTTYFTTTRFTDSEIQTLLSSLRSFEDQVRVNGKDCIKFVQRTTESSYINIIKGKGCNSYVGKAFDDISQDVSIGENCASFSIIAHEMIHALGFEHEQSRPDRDSYIKVLFENIQPQWQFAYDKLTSNVDTLGLPYDYQSVMHYDARNSFGIDWTKDTMIPLSPGVEIKKLDNRLSDIDISKLRTAYKCGVPLSTTTASTATTRITTTTTTSTTVLTSFQRLVSSISSTTVSSNCKDLGAISVAAFPVNQRNVQTFFPASIDKCRQVQIGPIQVLPKMFLLTFLPNTKLNCASGDKLYVLNDKKEKLFDYCSDTQQTPEKYLISRQSQVIIVSQYGGTSSFVSAVDACYL